jgi:hypothetical protein
MTTPRDRFAISMPLPPIDVAIAAWLLDLCGQLQDVIWRTYGAELEAHWTATDPPQPIYGPLTEPRRRRR